MRGAGDGFPFARERRLAWGVTLTPSRERGTACRRGWVPVCTGTTVGMGSHPHPSPLPSRERGQAPSHPPPPSPIEGEGDGVPPGMGSRLHGNDGWHGESPSPLRGRGGRRGAGDGFPFARERRVCVGSHPHPSPLPSRERGTACRRGWVPVCTGTTVGMGSHPHSFEGEGDGVPPGMGSRLHGNDGCGGGVTLTPALSRRGRGGRRAAGDGFPFARERRLAWGVTLTPALSRQGRGGRRAAGDGFPFARERRVCVGSHPHPSPLPSRERGTACRRGMGSRLHGNDGWHGESPSPQPSPVEGEGAGTLTPPPAFSHRGRGGSEPSPGPWVPAPACAGACLNGNDGWDGWHCATVILVVAPLERVAAATTLSDVRVPPSHRLEALRGKREGQHSIRINDQWRVCFRWTDQGAMEIEVTDYH